MKKEMYNEEQKLNYIEDKSTKTKQWSQAYLPRLFSKTCPYERKIKKDVSNFVKEEIIEMYQSMHAYSFESLNNMHSQLSIYADFCMNNGILVENHYKEINIKQIYSLSDKPEVKDRIITRDQLLEICQMMPNASDSFIFLCLFEGIKGNDYMEIRQITKEDINFKDKTIRLRNGKLGEYKGYSRTVNVSQELLDYARRSAREIEYEPLVGDGIRMVPLSETDNHIVRQTKRAETQGIPPVFTRRVLKMLNFQDVVPGITSTSIRYSGKIHFIKQRSAELGISSYDYVWKEYYLEVENQYGENIPRSVVWNKYRSLLE